MGLRARAFGALAWLLPLFPLLPLLVPSAALAQAPADYRGLLADIQSRQVLQPRSQAELMIQVARCWADVAWHERQRNESGGFAAAAYAHALALTDRAAQLGAEPAAGTQASAWPVLPSFFERRIRPDLWRRIDALGASPGAEVCRQQQRGCLEALMHEASHLERRLGWRTAQPYIHIVEDKLAGQGESSSLCPTAPEPPPAAEPAPPAVVTAAAPVLETAAAPAPAPTRLEISLLFDLDRDRLRPEAQARLAGFLRELQGMRLVESIRVSGHADRIAASDYNQRLSQRRAEAVKAYLVAQGLAAERIETTAFGELQPALDAAACQRLPFPELVTCLQPDRRVTVQVDGQP